MLRCLIVDDDPVICKLLNAYCEDSKRFREIVTVHDGSEALKQLGNSTFDLAFLDLNLPGASGKELLEVFPEDLPVIMVTSEAGFAVESYNFNVVGYLLKPFTLVEFKKALQRVTQKKRADHIFVKDGNTQVKVAFEELIYVKSESNYVTFYCQDQKVMALMKMSELEDHILPSTFIRIHRSYIVNSRFVQKVGSDFVVADNKELPMSGSYKDQVRDRLDLLN